MSQLKRLRDSVKRLHIEKGDILICENEEAMQALVGLRIEGITFSIPIVLAAGGVQKLTIPQLEEMLRNLKAIQT